MQNIVRVAAAVPRLRLANVKANVEAHLTLLREAKEKHASLVVFPELSLTGVTCGDLFFQKTLQREASAGLKRLCAEMPEGMTAVVGLPRVAGRHVYNCAAVINRHGINDLLVVKTLGGEDERWFRENPAMELEWLGGEQEEVCLTPSSLLVSTDEVSVGVTIGEDEGLLTQYAKNGAEIILRVGAEAETVGRRKKRRDEAAYSSGKHLCALVSVQAGWGESTSDGVYAGHSVIASCGRILAENTQPIDENYLLTADIDLDVIRGLRQKENATSPRYDDLGKCGLEHPLCLPEDVTVDMRVSRQPFLPENPAERQECCRDIFEMQGYALARRLKMIGGKVVVGISGGLDSTLALLAACRAMDILQLPRKNILGVTMPCFGTTDWTYQSALELMDTLGVTRREVHIHESVRQHFRDIGHDEKIHDVTYENAQARERTQVLMDLSNQFGGIVLGTGDLSEIALGWCTYNGDHMSMYSVNCGIPKTVVRHVVAAVREMASFAASYEVLHRILNTPISPELLPPDEKGNIAQQTEDLVGPYTLHDFFIYYAVRYGMEPRKIFDLCCLAFRGEYDRATILKWLKNFYHRFFSQQFKRNCAPDGVKISSVGLGPRGDWRMPSDAQAQSWLDAVEHIHMN